MKPPSARYKDRTSNESRAARVLHGTFGTLRESAEIRRFVWERVTTRFDENKAALRRQKYLCYKGFRGGCGRSLPRTRL